MTRNPSIENRILNAAEAAGCWIDDRYGQYGVVKLIRIARDWGWDDTDAVRIADACESGDEAADGETAADLIHDAADDAEAWLNDNVAPDGYSFGWHEGEFFLWSSHDWAEASGEACECEVCHPSVWSLLDDQIPEGCHAVASLWSWSLNYDGTSGPAWLFADMLVSEDTFGEDMFRGDIRSFGYVELEKLHGALGEYLADPYGVREYLRKLVNARG